MLGGVRTLLLNQEAYIWPTPVVVTTAVPSPTVTFGPPPILMDGSYTPQIVGSGSYTPQIVKTAG